MDQTGCEAEFFQPLQAYLQACKSGKTTPPFIPKWDVLPLYKLGALALAWNESGFEKQAGELASWLMSLEKFPTFWCSEKEYDEKEFQKIFSQLPKIALLDGQKPDFTLLEGQSISTVTTLWGNKTPLGALRTKNVEIRAMGPQSNTLQFGIRGKGSDGWAQSYAYPEVWLECKQRMDLDQYKLDLRFVGITNENPLSFSFYVKAKNCQVGNDFLRPKSLQRFNGELSKIIFDDLVLEAALPHKVQVIPLAGAGCYWDCEFLLSFEIHPFAPQANFTIHCE